MKHISINTALSFRTILLLSAWGAVMIWIYSCAAIQPPPGGPKDTTPPYLLEAYPPNETIRFSGGDIVLTFSEYMDESSTKNTIRVAPRLESDPDIIFQGEKITIQLPDDLSKNQTYVLTIDRDLKDEHLVPLDASIQLAYSTGEQIDRGEISGKLYGETNVSIHLWNESISNNPDSLFYTKPNYYTDVTDDGEFVFQYLSPGMYQILAVGEEGSGLPLEPKRMRYGMFWDQNILLSDESLIDNVNMILHQELPALRISEGTWTNQFWGHAAFNQSLEYRTVFPTGFTIRESGDTTSCSVYENPTDSSQIYFLSDSLLALDEKTTVNIISQDDPALNIVDTSFIYIPVQDSPDTTWLSLVSPTKSLRIAPDDSSGPAVTFVFSKPVPDSELDIHLTLSDSIPITFNQNWFNPAVLALSPDNGWKPNSSYKIIITQDTTRLHDRGTIEDSILTVSVKTIDPIGYGAVNGTVIAPWCNPCRAELFPIENSTFTLSEFVNSVTYFEFNHVPEGKYFLRIFNDTDQNKLYTYGTADPKVLPEQFFQFPDTISVRKNWEVELDLQTK